MASAPQRVKLSEEINYWNILLYADSGAGKTVFAGQDNKVLFVATEDAGRNSGTVSAARMGSTAEKVVVNSWEDVKNAGEWWEDHPEELENVNVLVIDSLPEMQRLAREYVLRETKAEKVRKEQDPDKMQLQDYGIMHELVENMVRTFNDLPVNVLYTATPKKVEDSDKNEFLVPDIQGKGDYGLAMKFVALMTCYGYMKIELVEVPAPTESDPNAKKKVKRRIIYWEDTGTIRGKDRLNCLAPFTTNATLQQLRLAAAGKYKRDEQGLLKKVATQATTETPAKTAPKKVAVSASPEPPKEVVLERPPETVDRLVGKDKTEGQEEAPSNELDSVEA